jgi:ubiquinone/menaquinone biosynthesis C-methylase UbiE
MRTMSTSAGEPRQDRDLFAHKADDYDRRATHLGALERIGATLLERVALHERMHLMDFGSGTGLLLAQLAPHVGRITAVDVSPAMHGKLREKLEGLACEVELVEADLEHEDLAATFDGVVTSMTLHHVRDVPALLRKLAGMIRAGGFLALSDLDLEDGRFHPEGTEGVYHHGFDRDALVQDVEGAGFTDVVIETASVLARENGDYPVFLLTARR